MIADIVVVMPIYRSWLPTFGVRIDVKPVSKFLEIDCFDHRKEQCLINENMKCSLVLELFTLTNSHCLVKLRKIAIFITSVNTLEKLILAFTVEKVTVIPFENQTLWFYHHNISKQCKFRPNFILCTLSCKLVFLSFLNLAMFLSHEKRE